MKDLRLTCLKRLNSKRGAARLLKQVDMERIHLLQQHLQAKNKQHKVLNVLTSVLYGAATKVCTL